MGIGADKFAVSQSVSHPAAPARVEVRSVSDPLLSVELFNPSGKDGFGSSLAASGPNLVIGSPMDDAVYLYEANSGRRLQTLSVPRALSGESFGSTVGTVGDKILVRYSSPTYRRSSVYVFAPRCGDGHVDPTVGELCDDGNTRDDDCCTSDCRQKPADSLCMANGQLHRGSATGFCGSTPPAASLAVAASSTPSPEGCEVGMRTGGTCGAPLTMYVLYGPDLMCLAQ